MPLDENSSWECFVRSHRGLDLGKTGTVLLVVCIREWGFEHTSAAAGASLALLGLFALPMWLRGLSDDVSEGMGIASAPLRRESTLVSLARDNKH